MVNWTDDTKQETELDILEAALRALRRKPQPQPKPEPEPTDEPPHDHRLPNAGSLFVEKRIVRDEDTDLLIWED